MISEILWWGELQVIPSHSGKPVQSTKTQNYSAITRVSKLLPGGAKGEKKGGGGGGGGGGGREELRARPVQMNAQPNVCNLNLESEL